MTAMHMVTTRPSNIINTSRFSQVCCPRLRNFATVLPYTRPALPVRSLFNRVSNSRVRLQVQRVQAQLPFPLSRQRSQPQPAQGSLEGIQSMLAPKWRIILTRLALVTVIGMTASAVAGPAIAAAATGSSNSVFSNVLSYILHLDKHMNALVVKYGMWTYAVLFAIVFAETGLVVTPFLPGDSLLFACGTLSALGTLNFGMVMGTLFVAAVLGDTVNYAVGHWFGNKIFTDTSPIFKKAYLQKTQDFYDTYGGKTVVLARFVPIIRTFAPFVAGVGNMEYSKFFYFNVMGAAIWNVVFVGVGYFFGTLPAVQENFSLSVLAIVAISVLPVLYEVMEAKKMKASKKSMPPPSADAA